MKNPDRFAQIVDNILAISLVLFFLLAWQGLIWNAESLTKAILPYYAENFFFLTVTEALLIITPV